MKKKQIIIIGGGISGLSTAWYLSRTTQPIEILLLEKSSRFGGWLHTDHTKGFHFEKGPRTFKVDKSPSTMQLIQELGLENELIWSQSKPHHRYLWHEKELHRFPTNPISFFMSPLTKGFLKAAFTEWRRPGKEGDETVYEFVLRRFNYDVARLFFDPLVVGIFGGDIRKISVRACFPMLKSWEEQYGCVTKGFWHHWKKKKEISSCSEHVPGLPLSAIFSFKQGIEQLTQRLLAQTPLTCHSGQEIQGISRDEEGFEVHSQTRTYRADAVFCALPVREAAELFQQCVPEIARELHRVPSEGITVVNVGYDHSVLPVQGFGYLTPTYSHEDVLGVVFDSSVFPQLNRHAQETRLTIKLEDKGKSEAWSIDAALKGIRKHLNISQNPTAISFKRNIRAIPQYGVGHLDKMAALKEDLSKKMPGCFLVGNYLTGVSVDQCIARAKQAVSEWLLTI